ncbi:MULTISPECIES: tail fiber protein [Campylobacter]|uniref:tail fiber protein n=1 Tax=Campylobacter TaxID=194 RepID=UPI0019D23F0E|nr:MULTISPECIES: tail fiber protein [Campylobacter]MBN7287457.1 tail fiber protein [Campylobacter curvus]MDU6828090.1 phage tail protein [Campylobacter sp.]
MANLKEENKWEEGIYQLEVTDPVVGGIDGISNKQAKQLANRTKFLKENINTLNNGKLGKEETAVNSKKLDDKTADAFAQLAKENTFTKNLTIGSEGLIYANNNDSHFLIEAKNKGQAIGLGTPKPDGSPVWHYFTHEGFRTAASVNASTLKIKGVNTDEIYLKKDEASDGTPIGAYLAWSSESKIPAGYLLCDGREISKSEYKELYEIIGDTYGTPSDTSKFKLPKFNDGRFMRGTGGNAAALGVLQSDEIKAHTHDVGGDNDIGRGANKVQPIAGLAGFDTLPASYSNTGLIGTTGGIETRPQNSAVVYIIKAKNVREQKQSELDKTPYATETKAGIIKVKNEITGQQEDVAVSEKAVVGIASIGINQTWQDMTSQRQPNVTYTNTTGRSIFVLVRDASASGNGRNYEFYVDGVNICPGSSVNTTSILHLFAIIPPNSKYKAVVGAPFKWYELR